MTERVGLRLRQDIERNHLMNIEKYENPGYEWWQLSQAQEEAFRIDRVKWSIMIEVYCAYEAVLDITGLEDYSQEAIEEARRFFQFPECDMHIEHFLHFCKTLGFLNTIDAYRVYFKRFFEDSPSMRAVHHW